MPTLRLHSRLHLYIFERALGTLDRIASRISHPTKIAPHIATGIRGEEAAYFHLRKMGYVVTARRWRTPKQRGDMDLIAWDGEWLCFIEVKTRSSHAVEPAEAAVDADKRTILRRIAREYIRLLAGGMSIPARFDVVSVYFETAKPTEIEVFRGAFSLQ